MRNRIPPIGGLKQEIHFPTLAAAQEYCRARLEEHGIYPPTDCDFLTFQYFPNAFRRISAVIRKDTLELSVTCSCCGKSQPVEIFTVEYSNEIDPFKMGF